MVAELDRYEVAVQAAKDAIGDGMTTGTITVKYHEPDWVYGRVYVLATCSACGASCVMSARHPRDMRHLAFTLDRYHCDKAIDHTI